MLQNVDGRGTPTQASVISLADYRLKKRCVADDEPQPPSPRPVAARAAPIPVYVDAVAPSEFGYSGRRRRAVSGGYEFGLVSASKP